MISLLTEDHNFSKAKKALMVTSVIGCFLSLIGMFDTEINVVLVKFKMQNPSILYVFIIAILIYQLLVFIARWEKYDNERLYTYTRALYTNTFKLNSDLSIEELQKEINTTTQNIENYSTELNNLLINQDQQRKKERKKGDLFYIERQDPSERIGELYAAIPIEKERLETLQILLKSRSKGPKIHQKAKILDYNIPLILAGLAIITCTLRIIISSFALKLPF